MTKAKAQLIDDAKSLFQAGHTANEVIKATGLSKAKIYQIKKSLGSVTKTTTATAPTPKPSIYSANHPYNQPQPQAQATPEPNKCLTHATLLTREGKCLQCQEEKDLAEARTPSKTKNKWTGEYVPRKIAGQTTDWDVATKCHEKKIPLLIVGHAGCGKSLLPKKIAEANNKPYVSLNCNRAIVPDDLLGRHVPKANGQGFEWVDGKLTSAVRNGYVLVLEEVNSAPPEILFFLHGLLEPTNRKIQLLGKDGEIVTAHPDFWLVATMNPNYEGTLTLNFAFFDRFKVIESDYNPEAEQLIVGDDKILRVADRLRASFNNQEIANPTTTRSLMSYVQDVELFGEETAQHLFANKYDEQDRKVVLEAFKQIK